MNPRDVLNRVKWDEGEEAFARLEIWYVHRGAPDDTAVVAGSQVRSVERSWLVLRDRDTHVPYHRLLRIVQGERDLWQRRAKAPTGPETG